ncbi:MAG: hypothetical protein VB140_05365 [Burkholderia sp.]
MLHKSSVRMKWNGLQTSLVRNVFVSPEIMPVDAIASSCSIYATTPLMSIEKRDIRDEFQISRSRIFDQ